MDDPLDVALDADPESVDVHDPEVVESMERWRALNAQDLPSVEPRGRR